MLTRVFVLVSAPAPHNTLQLVCLAALCTLVFLPRVAVAQGRPIELAGGYSWLSVGGARLPLGWFGEVAAKLGPRLWMIADVSGNDDEGEIEVAQLRTRSSSSLRSGAAGVRIASRGQETLRPLVQALVGCVRASGTWEFEPLVAGVPTTLLGPIHRTDTGLVLQVAAGFTIQSRRRLGLRSLFGYQRMLFDEGAEWGPHAWRVSLGAVVALGPR